MNEIWHAFLEHGKPFEYQGPTIWEVIFNQLGGWQVISIIGTLALMAYIKPTRPYIIAGVIAFIFI